MITYSHDVVLFVTSIVVSFVAAFTGLALTNNISHLSDAKRKSLIVMSAFVMGSGIWSMHFVAMLALQFSEPVYYNVLQTLSSALVAILVVGLALLLLHFSARTPKLLTLAGLILGMGIVAMHYIGMLGMRGMTPGFSVVAMILTVIVAAATGIAATWVAYGHRSKQNIVAGAAVFGFAVVAVHFTAMHGTQYLPGPPLDNASVFIGDGTLAVTVTIAVFVICGAFLLAMTTFITRPAQVPTTIDRSIQNPPHNPSQYPPQYRSQYSGMSIQLDAAQRVPATQAGTLQSSVSAVVERSPGENKEVSSFIDNGVVQTDVELQNRFDARPAVHLPVDSGNQTPQDEPAVHKQNPAASSEWSPAAPGGALTGVKIPFERNKKIHFVDSSEVGAIRADGRYTHCYTQQGTCFCPWSITEAEKRLRDAGFYRSHRSYLVNLQRLAGFEKRKDAGVCLFENFPQLSSVPVSRTRVPALAEQLGI